MAESGNSLRCVCFLRTQEGAGCIFMRHDLFRKRVRAAGAEYRAEVQVQDWSNDAGLITRHPVWSDDFVSLNLS